MSTQTQTVMPPINLHQWVREHRDELKPPVGNKYLYDGKDFFVMVIAGPNARNDFHVTNSEEYFYQLKGDIRVRIREGGQIKDYTLREGETFFIPGGVPHCPVRPPDTIGVVVERVRPAGETEHLVFYCAQCGELVEDIEFDCKDIVGHFRDTMEAFWADDERRTCSKCSTKVERPQPVTA
jgi:3-hydroxyanthranilate 3,4-dioxygenase